VSRANDNAIGPVTPELLGRLIDRHAAPLELYAGQWCDCAEDVVQDALVELAGRPEVPEHAVAWLYKAVRHRALNAQRGLRRRKRHEREAAGLKPDSLVPLITDALDAEAVAKVLEELPAEQREVVVAHVWGGLTFQEIGDLAGTSDSTAHRRYQAALAAIRKRLRVPCPKKN
jgi:RNA polymerase sigma-70 factor (ECF subfamily)